MEITFNCARQNEVGASCITSDKVPGSIIPIGEESRSTVNGRVIAKVSSDSPILVDTCLGSGREYLKYVDPSCRFYIPTSNNHNEVMPVLNTLLDRNICVLVQTEPTDLVSLKEELRNSFYRDDGVSVKNLKFSLDALSPEKMADAGFRFIGDFHKDRVVCHFNPDSHGLESWDENDNPVSEHQRNFGCQPCIEQEKYRIPVMTSVDGEVVTGKSYKFLKPSDSVGSGICGHAQLVSHKDLDLPMVDYLEIKEVIDVHEIGRLKDFIEQSELSGCINEEYIEMQKKLIKLEFFSNLAKRIDELKDEFVWQLNQIEPQLESSSQKKRLKSIRKFLGNFEVSGEISKVVEKVVSFRFAMVSPKSNVFQVFPDSMRTAACKAMLDTAGRELNILNELYSERFFVAGFINKVLTTGEFGYLFSNPNEAYAEAETNEGLHKLWETGTVLMGEYHNVSRKIRELLSAHMKIIQEGKSSNFSDDDFALSFENIGL